MVATEGTQQIDSGNEEHESSSQESELDSEASVERETNLKSVRHFKPIN